MAIRECPTRNDVPAFNYEITLDKIPVILSFLFNDRMNNGEGRWLINISDISGSLIIGNVPIVVNYPLFSRYRDSRLPPGTFMAFDSANTNADPLRFDLGERVKVFYQEFGT